MNKLKRWFLAEDIGGDMGANIMISFFRITITGSIVVVALISFLMGILLG